MLEQEESHAYSWRQMGTRQQPLYMKVAFQSSCNVFPTIHRQFELKTTGLDVPDPAHARRANFRVKKATLTYWGAGNKFQEITLEIETLSDESQGLMTKPRCVGKWKWHGHWGEYASYASAGQWVRSNTDVSDFTEVRITVDKPALTLPPPQGTRITGSLSINHGWPQEITVEWPATLDPHSSLNDMKFSTKLTPLPQVSQQDALS